MSDTPHETKFQDPAKTVVVPVEPTPAMILAGFEETAHEGLPGETDRWMLSNIWRAMIEAAADAR